MAQLIGIMTLGRDAELRYLPSGDPVLNLALAYNYGQKGQDNHRPTQWIDAALFGKRAETLAPYLLKATKINAFIGDVHIEEFTRRDQTQGSKLVGRIIDIEFAGSAQQQGDQHQRQAAPAQQKPAAPKQAPKQQGGGFDEFDSDIPF